MNDHIEQSPIILISGAMAVGKSTVAQHLAERLPKSVHLRGDSFRRMIVNGREEMNADSSNEAFDQLRLRYRATAETAMLYSSHGFTVICQDVIVGPILDDAIAMYGDSPLHLFVLCPNTDTIARRESAREKSGYDAISIDRLQDAVESTPRIGFWLDSSDQTADETVQAILDNLANAKIQTSGR